MTYLKITQKLSAREEKAVLILHNIEQEDSNFRPVFLEIITKLQIIQTKCIPILGSSKVNNN